jgi:hypothetical protein
MTEGISTIPLHNFGIGFAGFFENNLCSDLIQKWWMVKKIYHHVSHTRP